MSYPDLLDPRILRGHRIRSGGHGHVVGLQGRQGGLKVWPSPVRPLHLPEDLPRSVLRAPLLLVDRPRPSVTWRDDPYQQDFFRIRCGQALTQYSLCFLFCTKSLICLEGISMTPHRGNTILIRSYQQLPRLCLGPLKGFLS